MMKISVPKSRFEIIDQTSYQASSTTTIEAIPLFLAAFAAPKGPEDLVVIDSNNCTKLLGDKPSFAKYGQALLQVYSIANAGGKVLAKRVVASDATLANIGIFASITTEEKQKTNSEGALLYKDSVTQEETTIADGNEAIMVSESKLKFTTKSYSDKKNIKEVYAAFEKEFKADDGDNLFPLYLITDNGRGKSAKKFRISPDYKTSKRYSHCIYSLEIIEGDDVIETLQFSGNLDYVNGNYNQGIDSIVTNYSNQIKCKASIKGQEAFFAKMAEVTGLTEAEVENVDYLFANTVKQEALPNITLDTTTENAVNLSYSFGLALQEGGNGSFGEYPVETEEYTNQLTAFFDGTTTDDIYDLDNYKIDIICDANYPAKVKRAIEALVTYREDAFYFRDMGTDLTTLSDILAENVKNTKGRFFATYHLSFDVLDDYTRKPITVTCTYELATLLVEHFRDGRTRPLAGQLYGMVFSKCIPGTESFIPKTTPKYDQKQQLVDARINYASYYDGVLVIETELTSQEIDSQLSFINNVLAVQQIVKAVRTRCPKIRYSFIDGDNLDKYQNDVNAVLTEYSSNFDQLQMVYLEDTTMIQNKVYSAAILVKFKDFIQEEYFKIYALEEIIA